LRALERAEDPGETLATFDMVYVLEVTDRAAMRIEPPKKVFHWHQYCFPGATTQPLPESLEPLPAQEGRSFHHGEHGAEKRLSHR
jgi:hypothetical protein